ncbi:MAG: cobyrinic acid a,c-diamide synthase, partial [Alphaproteobacteria bacterium]|nr:cobyrinic acid a,c-diamide synthase [Alphaproteobacteria bacterium]
AVEAYTDIPVLGAVGRNPALEIGERHLGLTTPSESSELTDMIATFGAVMARSVDLARLEEIANNAPPLVFNPVTPKISTGRNVKIGIARDTAFGFYYADDLEAFATNGAELVPIDTLSDMQLPDIDGLFIGGGFPETQMAALSVNRALMTDIKTKIENGLPTYAECGGLMYLSESLSWNGACHEMVGVIPGDAVMHAKPQGRGYARFVQTPDHPWAQAGQAVKAHEFHYASVENLPDDLAYGRRIKRGTGIDGQNDAIVMHNLVAGFCHLRSSAANPWVRDFVAFVRRNAT